MKKLNQFVLIVASVILFGCGGSQSVDDSYSIGLSAETDESKPLAGVRFSSGKNNMGTSPESGSFAVRLRGKEGTSLPLVVLCPEGYESPSGGSVRLARIKSLRGDADKPITYRAVCTRRLRDVVLVIHSENGAALPVVVDGAVQATTDERGNAHVLVSVDRHVKSLAVSLDTSQQPLLRPQNPRRVFELKGNDAIALFDQALGVARPKRSSQPAKAQRAHRPVPYRLK